MDVWGLVATRSQLQENAMPSPPLERRLLLEELISQGVRITGPRKILIEIIQEARGHLDAATLLRLARKRDARIDRATVYRTLEMLKKRRLIDELDLMHVNGEKHYFEAKTTVDHVHLACLECGRIAEFTSPLVEALRSEITQRSGFGIRVIRLEVGGQCKKCGARNGKTQQRSGEG